MEGTVIDDVGARLSYLMLSLIRYQCQIRSLIINSYSCFAIAVRTCGNNKLLRSNAPFILERIQPLLVSFFSKSKYTIAIPKHIITIGEAGCLNTYQHLFLKV